MTQLRGDVVLNSVRYVLDRRQGQGWLEGESLSLDEGEPNIPVSAKWPLGLSGGMGETRRRSRDSNGSAFAALDCSLPDRFRLPPRRVTVTPTHPPVDLPTWFREQGPAGNATFDVVDFAANTVTGDQVIAHSLGVAPKAIILFSAGGTADGTTSGGAVMTMGFSDSGLGGTHDGSVSMSYVDGVNPSQTGKSYSGDGFASVSAAASPAFDRKGTVTALSASDFTINWTVASASATRITALLIGGADVQAKVINWADAIGGALSTLSVPGVGFEPDVVLHLMTPLTDQLADAAENHAQISFGVMEKNGNQWSINAGAQDAVSPSNSYRHHSDNLCAHVFTDAGVSNGTFAMSSMNPDGFSLQRVVGGRGVTFVSLALKGLQIRAGNVAKSTAAATADQAAVALPFASTSFLVASMQSEGALGAGQIHAGFGVGAVAGTGDVSAHAMFDEDNVASTDNYRIAHTTAAFVKLNNTDGATIDAIATCNSLDMNTAGWLRWTTNDIVATRLFYLAFAPLTPADTAPYILCFNGQRATQLAVSTTPAITVVEQEDFGVSAQCGHPAKFLGEWYLPLGPTVAFSRLTVIGSSGMTWTPDATPDFALAFATIQDGQTARLARGHTVNKVDMSSDGADWSASDFDIGDTSAFITSMDDSGTQLSVVKSDGNLYVWDPTGNSIKVSSAPITFSDPDNGTGLVAIEGTNAAVWNTSSALMLYRGDATRPQAIGPDANRDNRAIPAVAHEPHRGRHYEWWPVEDTPYSYGLYRVIEPALGTTKTYIDCYEKVEGGFIIHPFDRYDGVARGMYVDSRKRLWTCFVEEGKIGFWQLGKDGSPDAGRDSIGFGASDSTYKAYYPEDDFGFPHTLKQLRAMEVKVRNVSTYGGLVGLQLRSITDGGSEVPLGGPIVTDNVVRRFFTTETCYDVRPVVEIVTESSWNNTVGTSPEVLSLIVHAFLRPVGARRVRILIDTRGDYGNGVSQQAAGMDPKKVRETLQALERGAPISVTDPEGASKTLYITKVSDAQIDGDETIDYVLAVEGVVWVAA